MAPHEPTMKAAVLPDLGAAPEIRWVAWRAAGDPVDVHVRLPAGGPDLGATAGAPAVRGPALCEAVAVLGGAMSQRIRRAAQIQSALNASVGWTRSARRVGTTHASMHTQTMRIA